MPNKFTHEEKIYQELLLLTTNDDFMKDVEEIRNKCQQPAVNVSKDGADPLYISYDDTLDFEKDILNLREKYSLSDPFHIYLPLFCTSETEIPKFHEMKKFRESVVVKKLRCFKDSDILDIWSGFSKEVLIDTIYESTEEKVVLVLNPETTIKDIVSSWSKISAKKNELFETKGLKKVRRKNIDRDVYIHKLKKQGLTNSEIATKVNRNKKYNQTILGYNDVSKILTRLPSKET